MRSNLHRLKMAGVDVVFTADGIPEGEEGELHQGVKSSEPFVDRPTVQSRISTQGANSSAYSHPTPHRKAKSDRVRFVPSDPQHLEVVKRIFRMYQ